MKNQIIVKANQSTWTHRDTAPSEKQFYVEYSARGILTGLEIRDSNQVAWVIWESDDSRRPKPVLADFIEVVGVRLNERHSMIIE
jgi:hypothetical protein